MNNVQNNHLVKLNYSVRDKESGNLLDNNKDKPFTILIGGNQVISGLEEALIGKKVGSKFSVEIEPKDAYGYRNQSLLQEVPKEQFSGIDLNVGMTLFGQGNDGETIQVIVDDIGEDSVIIDYNHPLAGKTLLFDVDIISSREASEDEILKLSKNEHNAANGSCCCGSSCGCH